MTSVISSGKMVGSVGQDEQFVILSLQLCQCFFPENMIHEIKTPIFLTNAAYDSWQIKNALAPGIVDPHGTWHNCKLNITNCSSDQILSI
nr:pectin acetylesterase 8-like isoform X1 [Tanacetum cinerariifolium]